MTQPGDCAAVPGPGGDPRTRPSAQEQTEPAPEQVEPTPEQVEPTPEQIEPTPEQIEPTPEQIELRARNADKATRRALAALLGLEAFVVLLVPRAIAFSDAGLGGVKTGLLLGLAVVMIAAAAVQRRPWGIGVGSAIQVPFLLTGIWLTALFVVAGIFAAIWVYLLTLRHELVGTPGGARMLVS